MARTRKHKTESLREALPRWIGVESECDPETYEFDPIQLLEVAAHDLRNPISGILAASEYLLDDASSVLDEHHLAMLQSMESSSRSMLRLIDDVMELSNIESGKLRLDIGTSAVQPLLSRALLLNQVAAERKKVRLDVESEGFAPMLSLDIDPVRMLSAIDSLLASTIKLGRPGSRITIGVGSGAGRATISLRTAGSGISAITLRSLLNPFRKGRPSRPSVEGGTALALAKAKRIIEAHGGVLRVEGGEDRELVIKLTLPLPKRSTVDRKAAAAH
jgi:signal transduction histidine kinase